MPLSGYLTTTALLPVCQLTVEVSVAGCRRCDVSPGFAFRHGDDVDLTVPIDLNARGAVAGGTNRLERPRNVGLAEVRGGSGHVLQPEGYARRDFGRQRHYDQFRRARKPAP